MDHVTGLLFAYHMLCDRKVWLYAHQISMEQESELVELGKLVDEESFRRERKHTYVDDLICIDYLKDGVVYEIKKSTREKEMALAQIKYYLYRLHKQGVTDPIGILKVPKEKYQQEVHLLDADFDLIERQLEQIKKVMNAKKIPERKENKVCKKCAYYELCYI